MRNNLGAVLKLKSRTEDAMDCFREALALRPDYAEALNNFGTGLTESGRPGDAVPCFRKAIAHGPGLPDAYFNLATVFLALGEMEEGWRELEWRWATAQMSGERRTFAQPQWGGGPGMVRGPGGAGVPRAAPAGHDGRPGGRGARRCPASTSTAR